MNERFAALYAEPGFPDLMVQHAVPSLLEVADLGDDPLHLVAGPAQGAESLRAAASRLTIAEIDPACTADVAARFASDDQVDVVTVDPRQLPFPAGRFSAATVILSLLHLPSAETQDDALRELHRVLRPGAPFLGLNAIDGPHFRRLAGEDASVTALDALVFPDRLRAAGFVVDGYDVWNFPRFRAHVAAR